MTKLKAMARTRENKDKKNVAVARLSFLNLVIKFRCPINRVSQIMLKIKIQYFTAC